jgi:uncharacterized protein YjbI with pentapeptide repeats
MRLHQALFALIFTGLVSAMFLAAASAPAAAADYKAVEKIQGGSHDCAHCDLSGSNLSNQCVKGGDLTGADFTGVTAEYMCMSQANFTDVSFRNANLTGANLANSNLTGADFTGAMLDITSLKGADLSHAKGLTQKQIDIACADKATKLPAGLKAKTCS